MLFSLSSRVLEREMSSIDMCIPQIQTMSSFCKIFSNMVMSLVVLIYSRCGRCCSPQYLLGGGGGRVRGYTGSSLVNCYPRKRFCKQFISVNLALELRKDNTA